MITALRVIFFGYFLMMIFASHIAYGREGISGAVTLFFMLLPGFYPAAKYLYLPLLRGQRYLGA